MSKKKVIIREEIKDTSGALLLFRSLPEPDNDDPFLVKKFETAKARLRKCKFPKELEDKLKFFVTSKEFSMAPFKAPW